MSVAGIRPITPGFARCEIRPQLADLEKLDLAAHTVRGPIEFTSRGKLGNRRLTISMPPGCSGELVVKDREKLFLKPVMGQVPTDHTRYHLPAGKQTKFLLKYS